MYTVSLNQIKLKFQLHTSTGQDSGCDAIIVLSSFFVSAISPQVTLNGAPAPANAPPSKQAILLAYFSFHGLWAVCVKIQLAVLARTRSGREASTVTINNCKDILQSNISGSLELYQISLIPILYYSVQAILI